MYLYIFRLSWAISAWLLMITINLSVAGNDPVFVARHRLSSNEYQNLFTTLTSQSYRLLYVSGYVVNSEERFAAYFEKSAGSPQVCRHAMTSAQYQQAFNDTVAQGYRLVLVNGYTTPNGIDKYVAIWDKPAGVVAPWTAKHGMTAAEYQTEFNSWTTKGYRLKHVSGYAIGTQARYAAIFEKPASTPIWIARHGLNAAQYQTEFDTQTKLGYVLVLVCGYGVNNVDYYAAIFEKKASNPWIARHAMTSSAYQGEFTNQYYQGYRLRVISGYTINNDDRYAAIWENPNMSGNDLSLISNQIQAYMSKHSAPGVSIAITKQEHLVFAKGFGYADTATSEKVNPDHLFRIASVSKPMTSIAIMKLINQGKFSISSKVFGRSALLGTSYGTKAYGQRVLNITVQQLLEHTSGFSNDGGDPMFMNYGLNQKDLISWVLDNRAVKNVPGSTYEYLNFGYILLGRIIEQVSGQTYELFLRNNIFNNAPQTSKMVIGGDTLAEKKSGEVTYYPSNAYNLHVRRMDANGGWLARPIDLVGIMAKVDGFNVKTDILSSSTITTMWTGSSANPGYGKGWILDSSYKGHNGAMPGTISFLVRRNDGLSYAFTVNVRPDDDSFAFELKGVLDTIVSGVAAWPAYDLF
jgi:CubicO group peptidase (beta-lactamase class C family)